MKIGDSTARDFPRSYTTGGFLRKVWGVPLSHSKTFIEAVLMSYYYSLLPRSTSRPGKP